MASISSFIRKKGLENLSLKPSIRPQSATSHHPAVSGRHAAIFRCRWGSFLWRSLVATLVASQWRPWGAELAFSRVEGDKQPDACSHIDPTSYFMTNWLVCANVPTSNAVSPTSLSHPKFNEGLPKQEETSFASMHSCTFPFRISRTCEEASRKLSCQFKWLNRLDPWIEGVLPPWPN